jgi:succinoglycan biosynthesis transport protein ExoP
MENNHQLTTSTVNLFAQGDRFASASRLHGRLHRWRVLLGRYWWLLTLIVLSAVVPAWYLSHHSPPAYESQARMWLTGQLDIREGRLYTEELIDYLGTQAELLRSPVIQRRALNRLNNLTPPGGGGTGATTDALTADDAAANDETPPPFPFTVKVHEASRSSILELRARGSDPESTRAFVNYWMEEYLRFKKEAREETTERIVKSVGNQVQELAKNLAAQQEKVHAFQSSNNIVLLEGQGVTAGNYLGMLNQLIANLRTELRMLEALQPEQWIEARSRREIGPSSGVLTDGPTVQEVLASLGGLREDWFKASQQAQLLKAEREERSRDLRPAHPIIQKLDEEIAKQERLANIARDQALKHMAHRRDAIKLQIQTLEETQGEWDNRAIETSRKMADYDRLRQALARLQTAYDKMLSLDQTVDLSRTVEQENIGILEPASVARPINHLARNLAAALAGSLLLSFGLLYCLAMLRDDFSSLADLSEHLSEPVVGQIPEIAIKHRNGRLELDELEPQRFEFLESFRTIRSSLRFMGNGGPKPRTILIASSVPGEGKSTVALYLAATMAMGGSRVLLIDGDMRRGALHRLFGAPSGPGLAEILSRGNSAASAIVSTELENLALLPAGEAKRNPGELVLSADWNRFLIEVREQYDYILVDTPPVLAANDAAALASRACGMDGVLFVVRAVSTSARLARGALDALRQRHATVLGLIFNRAVSSPCDGHSYPRYQNGYGWRPRPAQSVGSAIEDTKG